MSIRIPIFDNVTAYVDPRSTDIGIPVHPTPPKRLLRQSLANMKQRKQKLLHKLKKIPKITGKMHTIFALV
ncbi:MAG: hypothetical protein ACRBBZ_03055 [Nitrosopumilus sp.]